ncbi:VanW family protein [Zafaria sp. Z1313]|uniref:VanW family protein n=1 Tax=unclassified Zafaria TaxID=2828765 RepID=UPI002E75B081|nr:VanW family protein [Zafaria sp. J156]MEE1620223.1 VanW family protein [Zafaria sp. J156]
MAQDPKRRRRTGWLIGSGVAVVVLAGGYAGAAALLGGQVPAGTEVHGIQIGGLSSDDAAARLEEELRPAAERPLELTAGGGSTTLEPARAGLGLDIPATLAGQTGFSLDPQVLWHRLTGGGAVDPVLTVDEDALRSALESAAAQLDREPEEGSITFEEARPVVVEPVPGSSVDVDAAVAAVSGSWFDTAAPLALPAGETQPLVPAASYATVLQDAAEPLVAGPVTVAAGDLTAELAPEVLADAASFGVDGTTITLELDNDALAGAVLEANPALASTAKAARIVLDGGSPAVVPSVPGRGIDTDGLAAKVLEAAGTAERTATVELKVTQPELTTAAAEKLGVKEIVTEFSTPYPTYDSVRTKNLVAGARRLNGVVVMPGETFSLQRALGPITTANGYFESGVVENGFSSTAVGGGLSQISTQMFNVGFLAGMDDVEHQPHSRWFDRYPAGREATLWEGMIDMKWRNNTDHAVMIQAWVGDSRVYTRLWGTKTWTVRTTTSDHYNLTDPTTTYNEAENCVPESGGQKGFTVAVTRERSSAAKTLPKETLTWTYRPWNKVVCGKKP